MYENSSLILLADVALENPNSRSNIYRKRRRPRMVLEITKLNGVDHAEVTDLKCLPISTLFNMFVEKFRDKRLRNPVYVCRFGTSQSCNIRFTDVDEKISRLEHLLQCHLLEHLMKTKTGSMIKLPKVPAEYRKSTVHCNNEMRSEEKHNIFLSSRKKINSKSKSEESEFKHHDLLMTKHTGNLEIGCVIHSTPKMITGQTDSVEVNSNKTILEIHSIKTLPQRILLKNRPVNPVINIKSDIKKITFDHSYSTQKKVTPNVTSGSSLIPVEFRTINVDNLYCLNSESSPELNSFMLHETLQQPLPLFIMDGSENVIEDLPLVGSEIEVTTEANFESNIIVSTLKLGNQDFCCIICQEKFSSRKFLLAHMSEKHSDIENGNHSSKSSVRTRELGDETKSVKRKRQPLPSNSNIDLEVIKENKYTSYDNFMKRCDASILKTALLKDRNGKKPVINISNLWNSINVQYI